MNILQQLLLLLLALPLILIVILTIITTGQQFAQIKQHFDFIFISSFQPAKFDQTKSFI